MAFGDGGFAAYDQTNELAGNSLSFTSVVAPLTLYRTEIGIRPERSDDGGKTWMSILGPDQFTCATLGIQCINLSDGHTSYVPMAVDTSGALLLSGTTSTVLYLGTYRLYQGTNTDTGVIWNVVGLSLSAAQTSNCASGCISAIQPAPSNGLYVYAGTSDGRFFVSRDGSATFSERDTGLPSGRFLTKIFVDPANPLRVLVTFSGFSGKHVFMSSDAGTTWTDITSNLPDVPADSVTLDVGGRIIVGTDIGVFASLDNGKTWYSLGAGLPNTAVFDLAFTANGTLIAATFGRGVWALPPISGSIGLLSVVVGTDGALWWSRFAGSWSNWKASLGVTSSAPVLCSSTSGNLDMIVRGADTASIWHKSYSNGVWSAWDTPGGATNDQPACASIAGIVYLVVRGTDNGLWYNARDDVSGTWKGWQSLGGAITGSPVLVSSAGRLDLVVQGTGGSIWHKVFTNGVWSQTWDSLGGSTPSTPAVASDGRMLHVVVRGADNGAWYNALSFTSGLWSGWSSLGGATPTAPSLEVDASGTVHLVVVGLNSGIYHKMKTAAGVWATSWDSPGGFTSNAIALETFGTTLAIMVRGMDGGLWYNSLAGSSWTGWTGLGGTTLSNPSLGALF
jgi:hypothetical protein